MRPLTIWPALVTVLVGVAQTHGGIIVNGSFEDGPQNVNGWLSLYDGDESILGWKVKTPPGGYDIDIVTTYWQQTDGVRSIDLSGQYGPGGVAQTFATVPGHRYDVSFMMSGNAGRSTPNTESYVYVMGVSAARQSRTFDFDVLGHSYQDMGWEQRNWSFTANSTNTELWFYQVFPLYLTAGPALDKVEVLDSGVAVPEPSSLLSLSVGLIGMGIAELRRRRVAYGAG